ncbi:MULTISPECIES: RagB/SusD family nutrient uptake outer membrane protein [Bacteroides]|uniref:RagB/SusD family nutrient uptake outer membrane protein n=1 Tax=Bacteroides TaxID=816 RepID=UPI0015885A3A|nr:RagB/SusD family nutrient uptake outer membrane protein [Bacteroides acidifaciens]MDE6822459.1 RagB/SusD family nutrient uptake outer membrane protein [Bacteroides acidifaciens]
MNILKYTNRFIKSGFVGITCLACFSSCNYLDVIPPAQPDMEDTMTDKAATLGFLFSCYAPILEFHTYNINYLENGSDETLYPLTWSGQCQKIQFGTANTTDGIGMWYTWYSALGQVHRFLQQIDILNPVGVTEDDKDEYKGECYFLDAYYHFRLLNTYGPIPIVSEMMDPNITKNEMPGRSHYDACVEYIAKKLDQAANLLPDKRELSDAGRADATICKCIKARILLYAASPLWNGSFYDKSWKNSKYETPGYGNELVSSQYERKKWETALTACQEAFAAADKAGYKLFDIETANSIAEKQKVSLPFIPGKEEDTPENELFKERVRMFQYLVASNESDGNNELIWGVNTKRMGPTDYWPVISQAPRKIIKTNGTTWHSMSGWSFNAPTLNTVQRFYTENGKLPADDNDFYHKSEWYTRFYEGTSSPALERDDIDKEDVKNDIIKFNAGREARYYAWIAFDGCQYATNIRDGEPLWLNLKNSATNGYVLNDRNYTGTGFMTKKFMTPDIKYDKTNKVTGTPTRLPFVRMAELYLNLAECYAALGNNKEALKQLNFVRRRAGFDDLEEADMPRMNMSVVDLIRNERFVELFKEGHRYYDMRRWTIAPQVSGAGKIYVLNNNKVDPTFEEFNKPILAEQPLRWYNRLYLLPSDDTEIYSNPQLVQSPGY